MRIEVLNSRANNYMSFYLQEGISIHTIELFVFFVAHFLHSKDMQIYSRVFA